MKKLLTIFLLSVICYATSVEAFTKTKRTKFKTGAKISGQVVWDKRLKIDLEPGEWVVADRWQWSVSAITGKYVALAKMNGSVIDKWIEIETISINGKWIGYLHDWFEEIIFKNHYDGCYERPEYYLLKRYKKGAAWNCFLIRHDDTQRNLYSSDDPFAQPYTARVRRFLRENDYTITPINLYAGSWFYSPQVGRAYFLETWINPEAYGAPKNKFTTEETSEYHPANINNYPKHKKYMESFISYYAYEHKQFEVMTEAKPRHKLDLDQYINEKDIKKIETAQTQQTKKTTQTNSNSAISQQLKSLHDLYKSGALTKEEFEKAKKKLIN